MGRADDEVLRAWAAQTAIDEKTVLTELLVHVARIERMFRFFYRWAVAWMVVTLGSMLLILIAAAIDRWLSRT